MTPLFLGFLATVVAHAAHRTPTLEQCGKGPFDFPTSSPVAVCRPIDDRVADDPKQWRPWTHRPFCADSDLCAYTDATALGNRGISIVATPEIAASSLAVQDHAVGAAFPDASRMYDPVSPPYEVRDIPGKGKGLVATQHISKDKIVMIDSAVMITPPKLSGLTTDEQMHRLLHRAVDQLPDPTIVHGLARKDPSTASAVLDILRTNSFKIIVEEQPYMALFPNLSVSDYHLLGSPRQAPTWVHT